VSALQN
jgi:hypothetical protein